MTAQLNQWYQGFKASSWGQMPGLSVMVELSLLGPFQWGASDPVCQIICCNPKLSYLTVARCPARWLHARKRSLARLSLSVLPACLCSTVTRGTAFGADHSRRPASVLTWKLVTHLSRGKRQSIGASWGGTSGALLNLPGLEESVPHAPLNISVSQSRDWWDTVRCNALPKGQSATIKALSHGISCWLKSQGCDCIIYSGHWFYDWPPIPNISPLPPAPSLHAAINQVLNAWVGGRRRRRWCAQATSICAWQGKKWRQEITVTLHSGCRAGNGRAGGGGWGRGGVNH